jgi:hypothetical protein
VTDSGEVQMMGNEAAGMWRLIGLAAALATLAGCGLEDGRANFGYGDDMAPVPEEAQPEVRQGALQGADTQFVYVNFDGVHISDCPNESYCSDAPSNRSRIVQSHFGQPAIDFQPYTSAAGRQAVLDELRHAFAPYNVKFTTSRPQRSDYNMLVVSSSSGPALGVAPLDCDNRFTSDILFVYGAHEQAPKTVANAAVHELGHSFGLTHVERQDDYLFFQAGQHQQHFSSSRWDSANAANKCMSGDVQDAPAMLHDAVGPRPPSQCGQVDRLAGAGRHQTAVEISRWLFPSGAPAAVLASDGDVNPDALAAGPLAKKVGGPLLLTGRDSLAAPTADELTRLGVNRVILAGGASAISGHVADQLRGRGYQVERLAGPSRYETAAKIARRVGAPDGLAFVASGDSRHLVDALAATGPAASMGAPIVLVPKDGSVPDATRDALDDLNIRQTVVVGGAGVIPNQTLNQLPSPHRIAGANRYETAVEVAKYGMSKGVSAQQMLIARSDKMPDALAAGASGKLLLLSAPNTLPVPTWVFLEDHATSAVLLGGEGALSARVASDTCAAL